MLVFNGEIDTIIYLSDAKATIDARLKKVYEGKYKNNY